MCLGELQDLNFTKVPQPLNEQKFQVILLMLYDAILPDGWSWGPWHGQQPNLVVLCSMVRRSICFPQHHLELSSLAIANHVGMLLVWRWVAQAISVKSLGAVYGVYIYYIYLIWNPNNLSRIRTLFLPTRSPTKTLWHCLSFCLSSHSHS